MPLKPEVGTAGGQRYPVLKSIKTFLGQMAEGGARPGATVLKELLQNADDAGATEVSIVLDERNPRADLRSEYADLVAPALLVRNNARFRLPNDVGPGDQDDFTAICDVASGHKRAQATAAGRFGIGFNSVYFLTDIPLLFSRREVHVFDLLHKIFEADGWRFPLDEFPAHSGSLAGPAKQVLDWCLPKAALAVGSFGKVASDPTGDYPHTVFRLPLRKSPEGSEALYDDRFPDGAARQRVLSEMADEAVRSLLFLKYVCRISFWHLRERELEPLVTVEATACPAEFADFLKRIQEQDRTECPTQRFGCAFARTITRRPTANPAAGAPSETTWRFHIRQVARFDDEQLAQLRARLRRNGERAVPWAAIAIPLNIEACRLDGGDVANWRVFLPLLEEGPSACVASGAFFIGPSRQRTEFRLNESDEGKRRTEWNQLLVGRAILPLLQDVSTELPDLAPELLANHPKEYVALFPGAATKDGDPGNLTEFARRSFSSGVWALHLRDIWNEAFGLLIGDSKANFVLELIPEWLSSYRDRFRGLSSEQRRFVRYGLGEALKARTAGAPGIELRWQPSRDVALTVLRHPQPPHAKDLRELLRRVVDRDQPIDSLQGAWAFVRSGSADLLRFEVKTLYVFDDLERGDPFIDHLRKLPLAFAQIEWVRKDLGLASIPADLRPVAGNVVLPDTLACLELLRRLPTTNSHDQVLHDYEIKPVVDFLLSQPSARITPDLRLGFLVHTAHQKAERRNLGMVLLTPRTPTPEDEALWKVWFRRIFAEVDAGFARELHRLLEKHPSCLETLHATDCHLAIARAQEALEILHHVRLTRPDTYEALEREINGVADESPDVASQVASMLLETADAKWESLEEAQRYTVLALPIHRRSDGRFMSLVAPAGGDVASVPQTFRLQSQDDIEDAPVDLQACTLLQTVNATVKRFYRRRIGLEEHGRVSVLKDTLRQIGKPTPASEGMLRYVVRYYEETVSRLERSGDDGDRGDARELRTLLSAARTVPCLDGTWHAADQCSSAWQVADHLAAQGWSRERLTSLLVQLFAGEHVASLDAWVRELLPRLHRLRGLDARQIPARAVTSESGDLSLANRVKLFRDNRRDFPESGVTPSKAAGQLQVPVLAGWAPLVTAEFLVEQADLSAGVLRSLAPAAVDLRGLATELAVPSKELPAVLDAFRVQRRSTRDLDNRLIEKFPAIWPTLKSEERVGVLQRIGTDRLASQLMQQAAVLDTVLVATRPARWQRPARVVSPRWSATQPPHLAPECQPAVPLDRDAVRLVWDEWCGVRTFGEVLDLVLEGACRSPDLRRAAQAVYRWVEVALGSPPSDEQLGCLRERRWVLGQRAGSVEFHSPAETLLHPGESILGARFWVPAVALPDSLRRADEKLGFQATPPATPMTLELLAESLAERAGVDDDAAMHVYGLLDQLLDQSEVLDQAWHRIARGRPVYRSFRLEGRQLTSVQLFIGDGAYKNDLSANLLCLKAGASLPKGLVGRYRRLGVEERPTVAQVLSALAAFAESGPNARTSHAQLLRAIQDLGGTAEALDEASLAEIRVPTCAGTYEPISRCYWDDEFGRRGRVLADHGRLLIDAADGPTKKLVEWLRERGHDPVVPLRPAGTIEPIDEPLPTSPTPEISYLLLPWRQWAQEIQREESAVRAALVKSGLAPSRGPLEIVAVETVRVRCRLPGGQVVEQSPTWNGPQALGVASGRVFVQVPLRTRRHEAEWVGRLDTAIACEFATLLGGSAFSKNPKPLVEAILATLERPSKVLDDLRKAYRGHFLHQYHDQVADPKFTELFEEYRRTRPDSSRAKELEEKMYGLLQAGFVQARREQIRGYGYDELSVFAELLQNAEDAYLQRARLGMEMPNPCYIRYRYSHTEGGIRTLDIEHGGRPFNYSQHGARQDPSLSRDVEGVLRSAGSFKPHTDIPGTPDAPTIGRFGLGFKSVYLLTDLPEVHSGSWHFAIEGGCLPKELPPPEDLSDDLTRIRLPLRAESEELQEPSQLVNLLPFLRMITHLELCVASSDTTEVRVASNEVLATENAVVERVTVRAPGVAGNGALRLLRCRSREHAGQLALLLAQDGTPARWDEAFDYDLFAVLPLRAQLACGVAASHRFEVQSGRTHLVDPKANAQRIAEVAALLEALTEGLCAGASPRAPLSELLTRFWALWRWERGDAECEGLRKALASALVRLTERAQVVPTLDPERPTSLERGPRFFFSELPDAFREALVAAEVTMRAAGLAVTALARTNVVAEGFAGAYRRACEYAGARRAGTLAAVGWDEVAAAFRERSWFAERPELLSCLASSLNEDQSRKAATWVALCGVLGEDGEGQALHLPPGKLLLADFPGMQHLPRRLLHRVSTAYDAAAMKLLLRAGLRQRPSSDDIREWVHEEDLTSAECVNILRYLAEDSRFREYWELTTLFRSPWFAGNGARYSTADAADRRLIPEEVLASDVFPAWLGLGESREPLPPEPVRPTPNPRDVLQELFAWWQAHGASWTARYVERLYPAGHPPVLRDRFDTRDLGERRQWITLLLLGALHTMGRTHFEQHRDFLRSCERKGWLDVFADREHDARRWMQVLEEYLEDPAGTHDYYQWMKQFVVIFQVSRWLPEYVESFLNVDRVTQPFALDHIIAPRTSAFFSGGGPDAPALTRALGMGACFVLRELMRLGLLHQPLAHRYCYVPSRRVCALLEGLGCTNLRALPSADRSSGIHAFVVQHLGAERGTFIRAFDLPLLALADEPDLQGELLGHALPPEDDGTSTHINVNG